MISLQGVPSVLIAKNQSWVRKQAQALVRHLPANVERADLIQVGLIAVAQAAVSFEWEGDRDSADAQEAFVRYARMRVKGAMLDELRQMDFLTRGERRKIKVVQIARERLRNRDGKEPGLGLLAEATGMSAQEISSLMQADQFGRHQSLAESDDDEHGGGGQRFHPATAQEEVEARVDTGIVLRRLERFFADLPERERMVIDAYLGVGLTPVEVAKSLQVTPSRVSQMYQSVVKRVAQHFGHAVPTRQRAIDRQVERPVQVDRQSDAFAEMMREREMQMRGEAQASWGELMEQVLSVERSQAEPVIAAARRSSGASTRSTARRNAASAVQACPDMAAAVAPAADISPASHAITSTAKPARVAKSTSARSGPRSRTPREPADSASLSARDNDAATMDL
ncbi:MAG TPA: sigma-70 family RNA polymerase sigma factor [Ideonella sp.]|uniref:sigma-70 family RNA polymerase sigma factor n=1 Tax=Ideonella sp. TaxID=1929293 RepID=UPI002CAAF9FD|nr:sigma-70 family RNA polymerase sigma factor [Ideonella sp.]HSI49949.1 sigma-70 family RNA polymerase sigma factor [Ideonella sp.]